LTPSVAVLKAVTRKLLWNIGAAINAFPQVNSSWVLAFFLPSLLFTFTNGAANRVRGLMLGCFLVMLVGTLPLTFSPPMFMALIPTMLVFSIAYLVFLLHSGSLNRLGKSAVTVIVAMTAVLPLLNDLFVANKRGAPAEIRAAAALGERMGKNELALSDQPLLVAWHADRPAVWLPKNGHRISAIRERFGKMRWLFLTEGSRDYAESWMMVYDYLRQWNMAYSRAQNNNDRLPPYMVITSDGGGKSDPVVNALDGYVSVEPLKTGTPPTTVVAQLPERSGRNARAKSGGEFAASAK